MAETQSTCSPPTAADAFLRSLGLSLRAVSVLAQSKGGRHERVEGEAAGCSRHVMFSAIGAAGSDANAPGQPKPTRPGRAHKNKPPSWGTRRLLQNQTLLAMTFIGYAGYAA